MSAGIDDDPLPAGAPEIDTSTTADQSSVTPLDHEPRDPDAPAAAELSPLPEESPENDAEELASAAEQLVLQPRPKPSSQLCGPCVASFA